VSGQPSTLDVKLAPLLANPSDACVLLDFDGTISPIVPDPAAAEPLAGAVPLLHRLSGIYAVVAVVSGRPLGFLERRLSLDRSGSRLVGAGLYGLERSDGASLQGGEAALARWRETIEDVARDAERTLPEQVRVERKGLTVTLHWRESPDVASEARAFAVARAASSGLELRRGRMAAELVPPLGVDKGTTVRSLCAGRAAACYLGDDLADLPAFAALRDLSAGAPAGASSFYGLAVAVRSDETPRELLDAADVVVERPAGALELLRSLDRGG
jgi:trehalose 6-phosphate phosphatase